MLESPLTALGLYVAVNILLSAALAARVGIMRVRQHISLGDGGNDAMYRAIRAHANNVEYTPLAVAGLVVLYLLGAPAHFLHIAGSVFTAGRLGHGIGLSRAEHSFGRRAGMTMTMLSLILIAGGCLYWAAF